MRGLLCLLTLGTALAATLPPVLDDEEKVPLDKLPKPVVEAVKKYYPKAELVAASKESEDGKTMYEVTVKNAGQKIDVAVTPEGTITGLEKEIAAKDLPKVVTATLEAKYAKATYKIVEELVSVKDSKETLEAYEVMLITADGRTIEVVLGLDGKIKKEEEGKKEEKKEKK